MSKSRDQWRHFPPGADGERGVRAPDARWARAADPTVRWGDAITLRFPGAGVGIAVTGQFMNIALPTPRVCSLAFNASLIITPNGAAGVLVDNVSLELFIGTGSSIYSRQLAFAGLPTLATELNFILADLPLNKIYVRASGQVVVGAATQVDLVISGHLAPIAPIEAFEDKPRPPAKKKQSVVSGYDDELDGDDDELDGFDDDYLDGFNDSEEDEDA